MTRVPATTDMHYRIGGIAETFMSTLLLMPEEQHFQLSRYRQMGPHPWNGPFDFPRAFGHRNVDTTLIYTHVLNRPLGARSPLDELSPVSCID